MNVTLSANINIPNSSLYDNSDLTYPQNQDKTYRKTMALAILKIKRILRN